MILNGLFHVRGTIETAADNILMVNLYCPGIGNFKFYIAVQLVAKF
jgi:hypothetical protein